MGERFARGGVVIVLAVVAIAGGVGVGVMRRPTIGAPVATPDSIGTPRTVSLEVHVGGWVVAPGVVSIPEGSRVADAVAAAGGMRPGAAADGINLASPVSDGDQVIVPGPDGSGGGEAQGGSGSGDGPIHLNTATAVELQELPGVGPVLAERIVAHREANGRFETVEDLLDVPGIGEAKLAALRDLVRP